MTKRKLKDFVNLNAEEELQWDILNLDYIVRDKYEKKFKNYLDEYVKSLRRIYPEINTRKIILSLAGSIQASDVEYWIHIDDKLRNKISKGLHAEKCILLAKGIIAFHRNCKKKQKIKDSYFNR